MSEAKICINYIGKNPIQYQTPGSAGADLVSDEDAILLPGHRAVISTGVQLEIPSGYVGMICPRSGLALKHCVTVLNAPGIIDFDYRGIIKVILINLGDCEYFVKKGDRIAQIIFTQFSQCHMNEVQGMTDTSRGSEGFGSTGSQ